MAPKKLLLAFKFLDMFGIPIHLYYNEKRKYKSYIGALVSLLILIFSFYLFVSVLIGWARIENSTTVYSTENYSVQTLLNQNRSIEYVFDKDNFYIYFSIYAPLSNGTDLTLKELSRYIDFQLLYTKDQLTYISLDYEECNVRQSNKFLMLDYDEKLVAENETNPWRICIKHPFLMGIITDLDGQRTISPTLISRIGLCHNTSDFQNCASENEIKEMIKNIVVQLSLPRTIYDFKNKTNPIKRMYKYEEYSLDLYLKKSISCDLNPTFLYKDFGLFSENYHFDSLNFNPTQQIIDITSKNEDAIIFEYEITISYQTETFYVKNQKLNEVLGSFGGIISILCSVGNLLCFYVNNRLYSKSLLKKAFSRHQNQTLRYVHKIIFDPNFLL